MAWQSLGRHTLCRALVDEISSVWLQDTECDIATEKRPLSPAVTTSGELGDDVDWLCHLDRSRANFEHLLPKIGQETMPTITGVAV